MIKLKREKHKWGGMVGGVNVSPPLQFRVNIYGEFPIVNLYLSNLQKTFNKSAVHVKFEPISKIHLLHPQKGPPRMAVPSD